MDSFLSNAPDARLASDLTLLFFLVILVPTMLLGFSFARRKKFRPHHKYTMTAITVVIWLFILLLMIVSYRTWVAPAEVGGPFSGEPAHILPTIHLITGGIAQILATYLVILMWTEQTRYSWVVPKFLQTTNIKPIMRTTLTLWLVTVALGVGIFLTWYAPGGALANPPEATEEPLVTAEPLATEEPDVTATEETQVAETEEAELVATAEPLETEEAEVEPVETVEVAETEEVDDDSDGSNRGSGSDNSGRGSDNSGSGSDNSGRGSDDDEAEEEETESS